MINRITGLYREYPQQFWVLMAASLVDMTGGFMLYPFFSLFFTQKFQVGMAQIGIVYAILSIGNMVGNILGGALADRFGRRSSLLFGLVFSAMSSILVGTLNRFWLIYIAVGISGLLGALGGPARQSMIGDLLPEDRHTEGFAVFRIVMNVAGAIGPMVGGFLAGVNYLYLFIGDAITSSLMAILVVLFLAETRSQAASEEMDNETVKQTFSGYGVVVRHQVFMLTLLFAILANLAYLQVNFSLAVFMRDVHGYSPQLYGFLFALNATMVIFLQYPVSRRMSSFPSMIVMAIGVLLYGLGLGMYGFISPYWLFLVGAVIFTFGEMVYVPVSQSIALKFAPEKYRGRFMAVNGYMYSLPFLIGPGLTGLLIDYGDPKMVWIIAGIICGIAAVGYVALNRRVVREYEI